MLNKKFGLIALLSAFGAAEIMASNTLTNYTTGDVLLCFRKGGNDMVVDAGPISTFTNLTHDQRYTISTYATGTQLSQVGTNGISWSAFTFLSDDTLFVTRARASTSLDTQTASWPTASQGSQLGAVSRMTTIPPGAVDEYNLAIYPNCTSTAVIEEDSSDDNGNYSDGTSYHSALVGAYGGQFDGNFAGNPENTLSNNFIVAGKVARSDFYWIPPGNGTTIGVKYLGYFEFNTNGVMTYVAYPTAVPLIKSIDRSGNVSTISYKTGIYGTYTLRGTNDLTAPVSTWPAVTTLSTGDNSSHSYPDTDSTGTKFYIITGQ